MKKSAITAAALALVVTPLGVDAEILSQKRLSEILSSQAPGPVDVETMRARDKDLLVALGVTLREKYGSVLTGSEIVFTRTERAGRIVYRMDFLGVKTQDHAKGICEILEMENCVILSDDGSANLISAEMDEDGLLSLDEYVPFSGPVRMQKMPASGPAWTGKDKPLRLPEERPEIAPDQNVVENPEFAVNQADVEKTEAETVEDIAPQEPPKMMEPVADENADLSPDITIEVGTSETAKVEQDEPAVLPERTVEERKEVLNESATVEVGTPEIKVAYNVDVVTEQVLPKARPSATVLASMPTMHLPMARPGFDELMPELRMALPMERPVDRFGLENHLPMPRDAAIRLAESGEIGSIAHSMIADTSAKPVFGAGFDIVQSKAEISAGLDFFSLQEASEIRISLPGAGIVTLPEELPSISVAVDQPKLNTVVQNSDTGLEMEIGGMDSASADKLPRVFVLSFAEDGVKAFPNARVEPAKPSFEIAQVVMTDAFAKPFDVRGDGEPDLQKLPKSRPDLSVFDSDIALVSSTSTNVLLNQLLEEPVQLAQVPGADEGKDSPADRLMQRLSNMGEGDDFVPSEIGMKIGEEEVVSETPRPVMRPEAPAQKKVEPRQVVEELPKAEDGLVDLDAMDAPANTREQALSVLGEIAGMDESEAEPSREASVVAPVTQTTNYTQVRRPAQDDRGIFDVAGPDPRAEEIRSNPELRIELSYATNRQDVGRRAKELEAYIPDVIMTKGRFYGFKMPTAPETYIIGIEARDRKSRDDIIWYLERMQIPWTIRRN